MKSIKNIISRAREESNRDQEKILRAAWMVSLLAPLTTGLAHYVGRTSVLLADFLRRSNEFLALLLAWIVFLKVCQAEEEGQEGKVIRLEKLSSSFMALVMLISGGVVLYSAVNQLLTPEPPGWLIPGMVINGGGLVVNGYFWYKNYQLNRKTENVLMANQWRFYRAKTLMDFVVLSSLLIINFQLLGEYSWLSDPLGSIIVAVFMWFSASRIYFTSRKK